MRKALLPERHPIKDFFICDIFDATPKDDLGSMEHPMFALRAGDRAIRHYEHNDNSIDIIPSSLGLATIFDKDVLIYCISQLVEALNRQREVSRTVRVTAYDMLVTTNRNTSGRGYLELQAAFDRLAGTRVKTNIKTKGVRIKEGFGLIDRYRIIERSPTDERMIAIEITLSEWLYNAIVGLEVLTISRDYFRLRKPLERRLFELARKHCGTQPKWKIGLELLYKKTGSRGPLKRFRQLIKNIVEVQHLPDYFLAFNVAEDTVTFYNQGPKGSLKFIQEITHA